MSAHPTFDTADLQRKDNQVVHPWDDLQRAGRNRRTVIGRAEGIYVYDTDGNELIDGPAGMWCVDVGHGREEIARAVVVAGFVRESAHKWLRKLDNQRFRATRVRQFVELRRSAHGSRTRNRRRGGSRRSSEPARKAP